MFVFASFDFKTKKTDQQLLSQLPGKTLDLEILRQQAALFKPEPLSLSKRTIRGQHSARESLLRDVSGLYNDLLAISKGDPQLSSLKERNPVTYDQVTKAFALCRIIFREFELYAPGFVEGNTTLSPAGMKSITRGMELDILKHELRYMRSPAAQDGGHTAFTEQLKTITQTPVQDVSEQITAAEKTIFMRYLNGILPKESARAPGQLLSKETTDLFNQLSSLISGSSGDDQQKAIALQHQLALMLNMDMSSVQFAASKHDSHYANFFSILNSGFVTNKKGESEFFLRDFSAFQKVLAFVDDAQASPDKTSQMVAFKFNTNEEAARFDSGLESLSTVSCPKDGHGQIENGRIVYFQFRYTGPAAFKPVSGTIKAAKPTKGATPVVALETSEKRGFEPKPRETVQPRATEGNVLSNSSGKLEAYYSGETGMAYSQNFAGLETLSKTAATLRVSGPLNNMLSDLKLDLDYVQSHLTQKDIAEKFLYRTIFSASSSGEATSQFDKNLSLSEKRAELQAEAVIRKLIPKDADGKGPDVAYYINELQKRGLIKTSVASPLPIEGKVSREQASEKLNAMFDKIESHAQSKSDELEWLATAADANRLLLLCKGDYEGAKKGADRDFAKFVDMVASLPGSDVPAIRRNKEGKWEVANEKLFAALLLRQGTGKAGLRFEYAVQKGKEPDILMPTTQLQKAGALLTYALQSDFGRSARIGLRDQVELSINLISPPAVYAPGQEVKLNLHVGFMIGEQPGVFDIGKGDELLVKVNGREVKAAKTGKEGEYTVTFTAPQDGKVVLTAEARKPGITDEKGAALSSGEVRAEMDAQVQQYAYTRQVTRGREVEGWPGQLVNIPLSAHQITTEAGRESGWESINANFAFGLKLGGSEINAFIAPIPNKPEKKEKQLVQYVGDYEIPLDRNLQYAGKKYSPAQLSDWAKEGKVGLKVSDAKGETRWFSLDGRLEFEVSKGKVSLDTPQFVDRNVIDKQQLMDGFEVEGNFIVDKKNKGRNYGLRDVISITRAPNTIEPENISKKYYVPNALVMPEEKGQDIAIGDKLYSRKEIRKMMEEGVIALVGTTLSTGKTGAEELIDRVYSPSGQPLGNLGQMETEPIPRVRNVFFFQPRTGRFEFEVPVYFPDLEEASRIKAFGKPEVPFGRRERARR